MKKCPICQNEFFTPKGKEVEDLGNLLSKKNNNQLSMIYPHIFSYCPNCGMVDKELKLEEMEIIKESREDLAETFSQDLDLVDKNKFARVAECCGLVCELIDDIAGATLAYKAGLDIIESELEDFETTHLAEVQSTEEKAKVLLEADLDSYAEAKIYADTLRGLVASTSAKSFEKLGYLGILIHLDTIIHFKDFSIPDKIFALLNDKSTQIPQSLLPAKNQIEDNYLKIRKKSTNKK